MVACVLGFVMGATAQDIEGIERVPAGARELLREKGFVVAGECTQVFSPYAEPERPVFITTDAVAHGYAAALRSLVRYLDRIAAAELRRFGERLAVFAAERAGESAAARQVLEIAAVACRLGRSELPEVAWTPEEGHRIEEASRRLAAAEGPPFLFAGTTLAPERFRPVAGYGADEELRAASQVRAFWSELALPLDRKQGREVTFALCRLVAADSALRAIARSVEQPFDALLGPPDDPGLRLGVELVDAADGPRAFAESLTVAVRPELSSSREPRFRVFGGRRTPGGAALRRAGQKRFDLPSGLDLLLMGPFRSEAGVEAWRAHHDFDPIRVGLHEVEPVDAGEGPHGDFLRALRLLQEPPVAGAPAWTGGDAWRQKQCWAQLGAWAEVRHAWALHAKRGHIVLLRGDRRPGVVSPYPAFFTAVADLAAGVADLASEWAGRQPRVLASGRARLLDDDRDSDSYLVSRFVEAGVLSEEDAERVRRGGQDGRLPEPLRAAAEAAPAEMTPAQREILRVAASDTLDPIVRMRALADLSRTCARLAASSWSGEAFDEADRAFVLGFGKELGFVCGYVWAPGPEDDAPVVVTVARTAFDVPAHALQVGVGRPERLWALVPDGDRLVVHQGAVLTYREASVLVGRGELDDEAWRAAAQRDALPAPPGFTRAFRRVP